MVQAIGLRWGNREVNVLADVVSAVGPAGSFLTEEHTVRHFRGEIWMPGAAWTRQSWDAWHDEGQTAMGQRLRDDVGRILNAHTVEPIDEKLIAEIDSIVDAARHDLG